MSISPEPTAVTLRLATPEAKAERDLLTHEAWGARLTPAQYQAREVRLRAHPWAQRNMRSWQLVDAAGQVLSSCESFEMKSFLNGAPVGPSFGVASVFTEVRLRGRGHAERMMHLLEAALREREPSAEAIHLYSDVGEQLYARAGYVAVGAWSEQLPVSAAAATPPSAAPLFERNLADVWPTVSPPAEGFVIWPDAAQLDWHLERERIYAAELSRVRPATCGARSGNAVAVWAADFKEDVLRILALVPGDSHKERQAVLHASLSAASDCGLSRVERWSDSPDDVSFGEVAARSSSLPMIRFLRSASAPAWRAVQRGIWV